MAHDARDVDAALAGRQAFGAGGEDQAFRRNRFFGGSVADMDEGQPFRRYPVELVERAAGAVKRRRARPA